MENVHTNKEYEEEYKQQFREMTEEAIEFHPNSPPDYVFRTDQLPKETALNQKFTWCKLQLHGISKITLRVVVFQDRQSSHLCYTS